MDRLNQLQKEIDELRKALNDKEDELYALKRTWNVVTPNKNQILSQPHGDIQQYSYEDPSVITKKLEHSNENFMKLPRWAIERYSRQILLPDIGVDGQQKLCNARMLIVGAGGLGCPAASYLAGAGVGEIGIVDYDTVDHTNIHRQLLYTEQDQFMNKVDSAAYALRRINSNITITPYSCQLDSTNALNIISKYNIVLDCTDNVPTRYLLNDACVLLKKPLISGSALKMEGQLTVYNYRTDGNAEEKEQYQGPCYRCLFSTPPPPETVGSCSAQGVAGPIPGAIGCLQALEAIKVILGKPVKSLLVGRMLLFDGEDTSFRTVKLRGRNSTCLTCSDNPTVTELLDYEQFCKTKAKEKKKQEARIKSQRRREEKEKRMAGQSYFGFRKTKQNDSKEKWIQDVPKSERKMGPPCKSDFCAKGVIRNCTVFTEEKRESIFQRFWNELDWREKREYVKNLVDSIPPKRRRVKHKGEVSRKGDSKLYHLLNESTRLPVCRVMFLNTLGIKEAMVRCWLTPGNDLQKVSKKKPKKAMNVSSYIELLPKVEPKCELCRSSTSRLYLDYKIKNLHQLYKKYVGDMKMEGVVPASRKTFSKVFNSTNIGIFKPKNDSDICDLFANHNPVENVQSFQQNVSDVVHMEGMVLENYSGQW